MQHYMARSVALENTSGENGRGRRRGLARGVAAAVAVLVALAPAGAAVAVDVPVAPGADVQARMLSHVGTDAGVAAPDLGDCLRYGSAPASVTTGPIANPGGDPGTEGAAWSDGSTGWVAFDHIAYAAHGDSGGACGGPQLDLSRQSAVGFAPASVPSIEVGTPFNLGRMVHRNNSLRTLVHAWSSGMLEIRFLGLDLHYPWTLDETPNEASPASNPANDDILVFTGTIGDQTFTGSDGNEYTLVVSGFTAPQADGTCAASLDGPGDALDEFRTVEQASTSGCLYASVRQVRTLTIVKVAEATAAPASIPAFSFSSSSDLAGSPWNEGFSLTPTSTGTAGAAATEPRPIVDGETVTIAEAAPDAPWAFTSVACTDGTGAAVPIAQEGSQIRLTAGVAESAEAAPLTCRYTNTDTTAVDEVGSIALVKTVVPMAGTPATGYTGGSARAFPVEWACTLGGIQVGGGTADVTTSTPVTIPDLPVGAECAITGEDASTASGDFADDTYAWDGFTLTTPSATVTASSVATLEIENRFVQKRPTTSTTPAEPTDSAEPTPPGPLPLTDGGPRGLAQTGSGPIVPVLAVAAGLLIGGAVVSAVARRVRRRA